MESITIRNLDDEVKTQLCIRATENGRSMEEEARIILRGAVPSETSDNGMVPVKGLGTAIHKLFKPFGSMELDIPPHGPTREPPKFD